MPWEPAKKCNAKLGGSINKAGRVVGRVVVDVIARVVLERVMRDNHPGVRPGWLSREYRLVGARVRQTVV